MRIKTNASPERRYYKKMDSLTQNSNIEDESKSVWTSSRFDITGQRFGENKQLILDELKQQEKPSSFDLRRFLSNVVSNKSSNDFWSPKSEITNDNLANLKTPKAPERRYFNPKPPSNTSNGLIQRNLSTLQVSKFPVFDSIPALTKLKTLEDDTKTTTMYEDSEPVFRTSVEFYPKPKDKSSTMISSKHNLFRMKPKKAFLEYSHYLNSNSQQDNKNIHRYKK